MQHQKRYNQTENGSGPFRVAWGRAQKALGATQVKHEIMFDHRSASFCPCSQPLLRCSGLSALATGPKRSNRNLTKKRMQHQKRYNQTENGSGPFHLCVCAGNGWRKRSFEQHRGQGKNSRWDFKKSTDWHRKVNWLQKRRCDSVQRVAW